MTEIITVGEKGQIVIPKKIRDDLNVNQTEMAKRLGIHFQTLSRYERGEIIPSGEVLSKIVDIFRINPNWLLTGKGELYINKLESSLLKDDSNIDKITKKATQIVDRVFKKRGIEVSDETRNKYIEEVRGKLIEQELEKDLEEEIKSISPKRSKHG